MVASPEGFWLHFAHFIARLWQLQVFNFQTLFPYSTPVLVLVLGIFLVWTLLLYRSRLQCRRSIALVLYFCLVWYLISNLPYLVETHVAYHLYLPVAGLCIGASCLALPGSGTPVRNSRLLAITLLSIASFTQMWKGEVEYSRLGQMSARMTGQLAASLKDIPKGGLVVLWPANSYLVASGWGEEIVPFSVQPPFTATDLYSNIRVIEHPDMSCCGVGEWWPKVGSMLRDELDRPPGDEIVIYLLSWNDKTASFDLVTRAIQRQRLIDCVAAVLGTPPEWIDSIGDADAARLVEALATLVREGGDAPKQD